jgi:hypothetical protein
MLRLFHDDRSTACQRVRLALEEKGIAWDSVIVDTARGDVENLPEDYHRLNPKGLVPVIIHDGAAIPASLASSAPGLPARHRRMGRGHRSLAAGRRHRGLRTDEGALRRRRDVTRTDPTPTSADGKITGKRNGRA